MCFLDIEEDGKIIISKEGMQLASVKALYNTDKNAGKTFFKKCMTYIFYVYNPEGIYKNKRLSLKRKEVCEKYINGEDWKKYEDNKHIQSVIKDYIEFGTTLTDQLIYGLGKDIDDVLTNIKEIPFKKRQMIEIDVNGRMISKEVNTDNSEEKTKAIANAIKLLDYAKLLKDKQRIEREEKQKSVIDEGERLFSKEEN